MSLISWISPKALHALKAEGLDKDDSVGRVQEVVDALLDLRVEGLDYGDPRTISENKRARNNFTILQQSAIHRADRLLFSAGAMIEIGSAVGLALAIRGLLETSAHLGYFCHRLVGVQKKAIPFDKYNTELAESLMGAGFRETFPDAPKPLHINDCIEKTDKFVRSVSPNLAKGMFKEGYDWLSEYAHPNFLSSQTAYVLDTKTGRITFSYGEMIQARHADLIGHLVVYAGLFLIIAQQSQKLATVLDAYNV